MKRRDLRTIVSDPALTPDALRIALYVHTLGPGAHAIASHELDALLHTRTPRIRQRAVAVACSAGWLVRSPGGWGGYATYESTSPDSDESYLSEDPDQASLDLAATTEGDESYPSVSADGPGVVDAALNDVTEGDESYPSVPDKVAEADTRYAYKCSSRTLGMPKSAPQRARARVRPEVGSRVVVATRADADARAREDGLAVEVVEELTAEMWAGVRSSIGDYLVDRVPLDRQWGWFNTVKTWLQGSPSGPRGLFTIDEAKRPLLIASALNELLQIDAAEEARTFRSARGKPGTTHVLRSKLEFLIKRGEYGDRDRKAGGGRSAPTESGIGGNFTGFPEG